MPETPNATATKVCANCANRYTEHKELGYDHMETSRCQKLNGEECGDVNNTTCDNFLHMSMDDYEKIMRKAMKKCASLQKEIKKGIQLGLNNPCPKKPHIKNRDRILKKYQNLCDLMDMLYTL